MLDAFMTASAPPPAPAGYSFGRFVLRRRERLLLADGAMIELGSRAVEVLLALVEADGDLLPKNDLMKRVWPGVIVDENNLQVQISALRRALGPENRDWIATVAGRGYRFTGPVVPLTDEDAALSLPEPTVLAADDRPPPLSVLVLPFAGRGSDPARGWFADSVTDSLTTDLARSLPSGSTVVAQASADTYRERPADVREIGRAQGVRYVLEGSVLLVDDRMRVNAQLILAETGAHLWADRFDTLCTDGVLPAQDAIVGRIAQSVRLRIVGDEARRIEQAERGSPGSASAADYVLLATAAWYAGGAATREGIDAAGALYRHALAREPDNADALAGIACLRVLEVLTGHQAAGWTVREEDPVTRDALLAEAEAAAFRALNVVPNHTLALKAVAGLHRARGLFAGAITAARSVLANHPGEVSAHKEIGLSLLYLGQTEEAVAWFQRADALAPGDPLRWSWLQGLGRALMQLERDEEAVEALRLAVASNPTYALSYGLLAAALALRGDAAAARAAATHFRRAEPETPLESLAQRIAVPLDATDPLYRSRNERIAEGLRRAETLLAS
jgi:TolB-like protein/Flp pilus assembly protein TadD